MSASSLIEISVVVVVVFFNFNNGQLSKFYVKKKNNCCMRGTTCIESACNSHALDFSNPSSVLDVCYI